MMVGPTKKWRKSIQAKAALGIQREPEAGRTGDGEAWQQREGWGQWGEVKWERLLYWAMLQGHADMGSHVFHWESRKPVKDFKQRRDKPRVVYEYFYILISLKFCCSDGPFQVLMAQVAPLIKEKILQSEESSLDY